MGSGSSCYPKQHRRSVDQEPYDAKRLLSELITVQTAIVLTEDVCDRNGNKKYPEHRNSLEYVVTTSLTVPTSTLSTQTESHYYSDRDHGLAEFQKGNGFVDILTAHFKHRVDVVKREDGLMPCIQEVSDVSMC